MVNNTLIKEPLTEKYSYILYCLNIFFKKLHFVEVKSSRNIKSWEHKKRRSPFSVGPVFRSCSEEKSQHHMAVYNCRSQDMSGEEREVTVCYPWERKK